MKQTQTLHPISSTSMSSFNSHFSMRQEVTSFTPMVVSQRPIPSQMTAPLSPLSSCSSQSDEEDVLKNEKFLSKDNQSIAPLVDSDEEEMDISPQSSPRLQASAPACSDSVVAKRLVSTDVTGIASHNFAFSNDLVKISLECNSQDAQSRVPTETSWASLTAFSTQAVSSTAITDLCKSEQNFAPSNLDVQSHFPIHTSNSYTNKIVESSSCVATASASTSFSACNSATLLPYTSSITASEELSGLEEYVQKDNGLKLLDASNFSFNNLSSNQSTNDPFKNNYFSQNFYNHQGTNYSLPPTRVLTNMNANSFQLNDEHKLNKKNLRKQRPREQYLPNRQKLTRNTHANERSRSYRSNTPPSPNQRRRSPSYGAYKRSISPQYVPDNPDTMLSNSPKSEDMGVSVIEEKQLPLNAKKIRERGIHFDVLDAQNVTVRRMGKISQSKSLYFRIFSFSDVRKCLGDQIHDILVKEGFDRLTPIQRHAFPLIRAGYDVLASAQTGSGKTLAFLCPTLSCLIETSVDRPFFPGQFAQIFPRMLILCPTRELAVQIHEQTSALTAYLDLTCMAVYGGENASEQIAEINCRQVDILTATPGRLLDLLDACKVSISFVKHLIFDEADIMLTMGFEKQIYSIVLERDLCDQDNRQTLLFSATLSTHIEKLINLVLRPSFISLVVGTKNASTTSIQQIIKRVEETHKVMELKKDLAAIPFKKAIIFVSHRNTVYKILNTVRYCGYSTEALHGKLEQVYREEIFSNFRNNDVRVLISTSVAARGLDFPDVNLVINYDMPTTIEQYTHRIGRTGRIGNDGMALSYFTTADRKLANSLVKVLDESKQCIPQWLTHLVYPRRRMIQRYSFKT